MIINNRSHYSVLKTGKVTVSVHPVAEVPREVYRVSNAYDVGLGEQTVILEHAGYYARGPVKKRADRIRLPERIDNQKFVYTGKKHVLAYDLKDLIEVCPQEYAIEAIIPDVLAPGDLVTFKESKKDAQILIVDCLRIVKHSDKVKKRVTHAV